MTPETRNEQTDDPLKDHNRLLIDLLFIGGILSANFDCKTWSRKIAC